MIPYWRPDTPIRPPLITTCVVTSPRGEITLVPLRDELIIGRGDVADIRLLDDMQSRRHCRLRRTGRGLVVEDMHSENGTYMIRQLTPGVPELVTVGATILPGRSKIQFVHELPETPIDPDVATLVAAICETPDDDEPRLVLADLLTSRGDPRGELITCQIAAESSVNADAGGRADALLREHELAWLAPLPVPIASWTFRRGFLDCVWVLPGQSVAALRGHHPLRAVVELG